MFKSEKLTMDSRLSDRDCLAQLAQAMNKDRQSAAKPLHGTINGNLFNIKAAWFLKITGLVEPVDGKQTSRIKLSFDIPAGLSLLYSLSLAFLLGTTFSVVAYNHKSATMDVFASYWAALILIMAPSLFYLVSATFILGLKHASQKHVTQTIVSICQCEPVHPGAQTDPFPSARKSMILNVVLHLFPLIAGWLLVPVVIDKLHQSAWQLWTKGEYKNAESFCRPILFLSEIIDGKDGNKASYAKYITAECCRCSGNLGEAQRLYKESLLCQLKLYMLNDPRIAWTYDNLGRVQEKLGELQLADKSYLEALKIWQTDKETQAPLIARLKDRRAFMYLNNMLVSWDKDKPELLKKAQTDMEEALEIDRKIFKNAPSLTIAQDINDLGVIKWTAGDVKGAQKCFEEALAQKKLLDKDKLSMSKTMMNLYFITGVPVLKKEVLEIWRDHLTPGESGLTKKEMLEKILDKTRNTYEYPNVYTRLDKVIPEALK